MTDEDDFKKNFSDSRFTEEFCSEITALLNSGNGGKAIG